jgi:hypothetical protein
LERPDREPRLRGPPFQQPPFRSRFEEPLFLTQWTQQLKLGQPTRPEPQGRRPPFQQPPFQSRFEEPLFLTRWTQQLKLGQPTRPEPQEWRPPPGNRKSPIRYCRRFPYLPPAVSSRPDDRANGSFSLPQS